MIRTSHPVLVGTLEPVYTITTVYVLPLCVRSVCAWLCLGAPQALVTTCASSGTCDPVVVLMNAGCWPQRSHQPNPAAFSVCHVKTHTWTPVYTTPVQQHKLTIIFLYTVNLFHVTQQSRTAMVTFVVILLMLSFRRSSAEFNSTQLSWKLNRCYATA